MSMPKVAVVAGLLLCVIGIVGVIVGQQDTGKIQPTALIPFFIGDIFILLGIISIVKPNLRKHMMHFLAMIALLGFGGATFSFIKRYSPEMATVAMVAMLSTAAICLITLLLCIKSFIDARKARTIG